MGSSSLRAPGGLPRPMTLGSPRYRTAVAGALVVAVVLIGGASRAAEWAQLPVRLAAIAVVAASLWPLDATRLRLHRRFAFFALACLALPLVQLLPLPPDLWAALPGRAPYAAIAEATGTTGWRPASLTPDLTVNALQALLVPMAAGLAAIHLEDDGRRIVAGMFVAAGLLSAVLGLAQLGVAGDGLRLFAETSADAPVGLLANRNHQAVLLACALPLCAAVVPRRAIEHRPLVVSGLALAGALIVSAVLLLTGSRMGALLWLGGILGAGWTVRARGLLATPRSPAPLALWSAVGLATLFAAGALLLDSELLERFRTADIASDTRSAALPSLLATAHAFFPAGAGLGAFDSVYRQFEPDALLSTIYLNQAHNEPLQLAIEGGLPALALLLVFAGWWFGTTWQLARQRARFPGRGLDRASIAVTALLMLSSLVDYPLRTPLLSALFVFCCVAMAASAVRERPPGPAA
jgi:O-antigen ligase